MNKTILLIEDEFELQQNLKEILEHHGFSIMTADNGHEALITINNQVVDLILCDIMMPVMDGHEFFKIIRSQESFRGIPFMFLSAKTSDGDKEKGLSMGADGYLLKPISARVLLNSVFEAIDKRNGSTK